MVNGPVGNFEDCVADGRRVLREAVGQFATDHLGDDFVFGDAFGAVHVDVADGLAVTDDRRGIGDLADLSQLMGDDDHGDALFAELTHQLKQVLRVIVVECCGRLVQDQELNVLGQCLCDFNELLLANAQVDDARVRVDIQPNLVEQFLRQNLGFVPVNESGASPFIAKENVFRNGQKRGQRQFLVNDDDADVLRFTDGLEATFVTNVFDGAFVGTVGVDTRQDLHEGGLAGAVLTADCVDFPSADLHRHVIEGSDSREFLDDM
ncbi:Uncharacterised protein [Chlamydia trachomatis]|nr:Uncharacterised protein [Chlamydia trachomatis]